MTKVTHDDDNDDESDDDDDDKNKDNDALIIMFTLTYQQRTKMQKLLSRLVP